MDKSPEPLSNTKLPSPNAEKFQMLLYKMGLKSKYPQKLSLRDAMTIHEEVLKTKHTTDQLPLLPNLILQKIMMCDQRCRSCLFQVNTQNMSACDSSDSESSCSESSNEDLDDPRLHPVDCILAVLHCCDNILRQDLISKLSYCQLAIPLLLHDPTNNSVTFLLWALRSLIRGWKCYETGEQENRIVDYKGPIISFLRIGTSKSSKSEILNAVISDESKSFFFRRGCQGGDCKRNFVEGLVEMSCYFPSGRDRDTDAFPIAITFVNLRGDAQSFKRQVAFLEKISFMSVVLTAEANIDNNNIKILENLCKAPGGIILLLAESETKKNKIEKDVKERMRQILPKDKCAKIKLKGVGSMDTIKTEIQKILNGKLINTKPTYFRSISDCCQFACENDIIIDENVKDSQEGKKCARMVMQNVHSVNEFDKVKDKMLPLQGPELWYKWAELDKEHYRHVNRKEENVTEYNAKIFMEKIAIRKQQLQKCKEVTPLMNCFMTNLLQTSGKTRMYFLQWLKLLLDDHSRKILPQLNKNYKCTRDNLLALKHKQVNDDKEKIAALNKECKSTQGDLFVLKHNQANDDEEKIKKLTKQLKDQNEKLIRASFGLEHLLREMCQIYESRMECCTASEQTASEQTASETSLIQQANCLPQVMAEIMDEGHALELMDGDASHVPKLWVLAVIQKLKAICDQNSRKTV